MVVAPARTIIPVHARAGIARPQAVRGVAVKVHAIITSGDAGATIARRAPRRCGRGPCAPGRTPLTRRARLRGTPARRFASRGAAARKHAKARRARPSTAVAINHGEALATHVMDGGLVALDRDAQDKTGHDHRRQHGRSAVANEGNGFAGHRRDAQDTHDVDKELDAKHERGTVSYKPAKPIRAARSNPKGRDQQRYEDRKEDRRCPPGRALRR